MQKKCIDISHYQGNINWDAVKADGVEFVIMRGGLGDDIASQDDKFFERNWSECKRVGIPCTMYLFSYAAAKNGDISSEIAHIKRLMTGKTPDGPIYIDVENTSGLNWRSISNEFMLDIFKRYKEELNKLGFDMGIYSSRSAFWNEKMGDPWYQNNVSIWVAEYANQVNNFNRPYDIWQYSSSGSVSGINGRVDMDWLYKDFTPDVKPTPITKTLTTHYAVYDKVKEKWLPFVTGYNKDDKNNGYAGIIGNDITGITVSVEGDSIEYNVGTIGGNWLGVVTGCDESDYENGYAGKRNLKDSAPIDRFMIRSTTGKIFTYCVCIKENGKDRWLPEVTGFDKNNDNNGYAGKKGYPITSIMIKCTEETVEEPPVEEPTDPIIEEPIITEPVITDPVATDPPVEEPVSDPINDTIEDPIISEPGDVNGDGVINDKDLELLREYIANYDYDTETSPVKVATGADVNQDGIINTADIVALKEILQKQQENKEEDEDNIFIRIIKAFISFLSELLNKLSRK